MQHSIDQEMLDALELFFYASSFKHRRFLCCLEPSVDPQKMLLDLRLLLQANLEVILLLSHKQQQSFPTGYPVVPCQTFEDVTPALANNLMPMLSVDTGHPGPWPFDLAKQFGAKRILWIGEAPGILAQGEVISHLDLTEFKNLTAGQLPANIQPDWLPLIAEGLQKDDLEWVFTEGEAGALFQEVFTHQGAGTLVAKSYGKQITSGSLGDLVDLLFLMRPYVKEGLILPLSEAQLTKEIEQFWLYRLNGSVVVAARCKVYGDEVELGKFCSLPRYQGKGRAQELVKAVAAGFATQGKKALFALTIDPKMGSFFERLGFESIERERLPPAWAKNYDFSRPSKAYWLELSP